MMTPSSMMPSFTQKAAMYPTQQNSQNFPSYLISQATMLPYSAVIQSQHSLSTFNTFIPKPPGLCCDPAWL